MICIVNCKTHRIVRFVETKFNIYDFVIICVFANSEYRFIRLNKLINISQQLDTIIELILCKGNIKSFNILILKVHIKSV